MRVCAVGCKVCKQEGGRLRLQLLASIGWLVPVHFHFCSLPCDHPGQMEKQGKCREADSVLTPSCHSHWEHVTRALTLSLSTDFFFFFRMFLLGGFCHRI